MTNQSTIDKLIEMRLTSMADAFRNQLNDPKFKEIPFEDRFAMLVDIEYSNRKNNRLKRLIRNAGFDQPEANIMDINYTSGRKLNKNLISRLATCEYISEHRNLFITGATGCGKTYMACAFGMEACKRYFTTKYIRLPDLLIDLEIARSEGSYRKVLAKYANPLVLILDEWLLLKPTEIEQKDIFELLHRRRKKSSTIFCSQYGFEEWYDQLGGDDSPLADAIIDRIAHDSYRINITSIDAEHDISISLKSSFYCVTGIISGYLGDISPENIKEVFKRINSTQYALNSIELHNAIYDGEFIATAKEILEEVDVTKLPFFSDSKISRMDDLLFILLIMSTVQEGGYFVGDKYIEKYVATYNENYPDKNNVKKKIVDVFSFINELSLLNDSLWMRKSCYFTMFIEIFKEFEKIAKKRKILREYLQEVESKVEANKSSNADTNQYAKFYSYIYTGTNSRKARVERGNFLRKEIIEPVMEN